MADTPKKPRFYTGARLWWSLAFFIFLCGCGFAIAELVAARTPITLAAFEDARRITITTATGTIEGKPPAVEAPVPPPPAEETPPATPEHPAEAPAPAAPETGSYVAPDNAPPVTAPAVETPAAAPAAPAASAPTPPAEPKTFPDPVTSTLPAPALPSGNAMADAPAEALSEQTESGVLPIVASDGTKPWQYYAKPFVREGTRPAIAIIVTDLGMNREVTEAAANLPDTVTLSLSPYAPEAGAWAKSLRTRGHELLVDLPLEPVGYPATDPGPEGMLTTNSTDQNLQRLTHVLGHFPGYIGVRIPAQERFTSNRDAAYPIMRNINRRGLVFVLTAIPEKSVEELFKYNSFPYLASDAQIDLELNPAAINKRLAQLEETARRQGYAIGMAQAVPLSIQQLGAWIATLESHNIELVPISAIAKTKYQ